MKESKLISSHGEEGKKGERERKIKEKRKKKSVNQRPIKSLDLITGRYILFSKSVLTAPTQF